MRLVINDCFSAPSYRTVHLEDGVYETCVGRYVVAYVTNGDYREVYIFTKDADCAPYVWLNPDEDVADRFADRVLAAGTINEDLWMHVRSEKLHQLPDYVLDPTRPEFN